MLRSSNKLFVIFSLRSHKQKILWSILLVICCVIITVSKYRNPHTTDNITNDVTNSLKFQMANSMHFYIQDINLLSQLRCSNFATLKVSRKKLLVVLVLSARDNLVRRNTIRQTWGSVQKHKRWEVIVMFVLGESKEDKLSDKIMEEGKLHGDLIIGSFIDTYRTLTVKTLTGFAWFLDKCSTANYVLKTDDDVFIDIFQLLKHVSNLKEDNTISCRVNHLYAPQINDTRSRWHVTYEEYDKEVYPDYCTGTGYLISSDVVKALFDASLNSESIFWIEDVFITGILREYLTLENILQPKLLSFSNKFNIIEIEKWEEWCNAKNSDKLPWIFILLWSESNEEFVNDFSLLWNKTASVHALK